MNIVVKQNECLLYVLFIKKSFNKFNTIGANTFASKRLSLGENNESLRLKNPSNLTDEFLYSNLDTKI